MTAIFAKRKRAWGIVALGFLAVIAAIIYFRPPTLEQVARRGLKAVETRDASLLIRNLSRAEVNKLNLNERNVSRFLETFVGRRLSGFVPTGVPKFTAFPDSQKLL